jgi:phosphoribosylglycinamide formyltransferase-1
MEAPVRPSGHRRSRLVVLVSGDGSNLQAVLDGCVDGPIDGEVAAVVSDRTDAYGLERARKRGVPSKVLEPRNGEVRRDYDARLADAVAAFAPDHVVLAGWMRILTMGFLGRFPGRVINLHPALPGDLPGTHAIERAWNEAGLGIRDHSGVMVHLVPDEGVDDGPVLATRRVPVAPTDSAERFAARMHETEHELLVEVLTEICHPSHERSEAAL